LGFLELFFKIRKFVFDKEWSWGWISALVLNVDLLFIFLVCGLTCGVKEDFCPNAVGHFEYCLIDVIV
jgi:hypothetical protein